VGRRRAFALLALLYLAGCQVFGDFSAIEFAASRPDASDASEAPVEAGLPVVEEAGDKRDGSLVESGGGDAGIADAGTVADSAEPSDARVSEACPNPLDAGSSSSWPICAGCISASCPAAYSACLDDCPCQERLQDYVDCIEVDGSTNYCGAAAVSGNNLATMLFLCANDAGCMSSCGK